MVAALVAYPGTFLLSYWQPSDDGVVRILSTSLVAGTVNFILFVTTGGIIFRKRITQSIQTAESPQGDGEAPAVSDAPHASPEVP
jgi:hypothetical protein